MVEESPIECNGDAPEVFSPRSVCGTEAAMIQVRPPHMDIILQNASKEFLIKLVEDPKRDFRSCISVMDVMPVECMKLGSTVIPKSVNCKLCSLLFFQTEVFGLGREKLPISDHCNI